MSRRVLSLVVIALLATLLTAGTCRHARRCKVSADCLGSMICGTRGVCVVQCKNTFDCPPDKQCVEGTCRRPTKGN